MINQLKNHWPLAYPFAGGSSRAHTGLFFVASIFILWVGYGHIVGSYFLADDFTHLFALTGSDGQPRWELAWQHWFGGQHFSSWRPMVTLYELFLLQVFGANPVGFHLANLSVHLINTWLLVLIIQRLGGSPALSFVGGLLFLSFPLHSEAVTWIAASPVLLCTGFGFASILFFLKWRIEGRWSQLLLSMSLMVFAMASKEEALALPFVIGWMAFILKDHPFHPRSLLSTAILALPYFILIAIYFGWRSHVFGDMVPNYILIQHDKLLGQVVSAALHVLEAFAAPLNAERFALLYPLVKISYGLSLTFLLIYWSFISRRKWRLAILWLIASLGFLIPTYVILSNGIDPGLTNSRFLYLPATGFCGFLAVILVGGYSSRPKFAFASIVVLIGSNLVLLHMNNIAWQEAGLAMKTLRDQTLEASGQDPRVEVVNIPDKINGVLFDRGGWAYARFAPFVAGTTTTQRTRLVNVQNTGSIPFTLYLENQDEAFYMVGGNSRIIAPEETSQIPIKFDPKKAGLQTGILQTRYNCDQEPQRSSLITFTGTGMPTSPVQTWISASITPSPNNIDGQYPKSFAISVSDAVDGLDAIGITLSLPKDAPWNMSYNQVEDPEKSGPFNLADGDNTALIATIDLQNGAKEWPVFAPKIMAINAVSARRLNPVADFLEPISTNAVFGTVVYDPNKREPKVYKFAPVCSNAPQHSPALAKEVNFGPLSIEPPALNTGQSPQFLPENPPHRLFWDDLNNRVIPYSEVQNWPVIYEADAGSLQRFIQPDDQRHVQINANEIAFSRKDAPIILLSPKVEIQPQTAHYFIVEMRAIGVTNPFAIMAWSDSDEPEFVEKNWLPLVITPDGRWRSYTISLHDNPKWQDSNLVRQIRFSPSLVGGYVELRGIKLIGYET